MLSLLGEEFSQFAEVIKADPSTVKGKVIS
jgi:hypothetical protein